MSLPLQKQFFVRICTSSLNPTDAWLLASTDQKSFNKCRSVNWSEKFYQMPKRKESSFCWPCTRRSGFFPLPMQQPSNLTRFLYWSFETNWTSFVDSSGPCPDFLESPFTAISCPSNIPSALVLIFHRHIRAQLDQEQLQAPFRICFFHIPRCFKNQAVQREMGQKKEKERKEPIFLLMSRFSSYAGVAFPSWDNDEGWNDKYN